MQCESCSDVHPHSDEQSAAEHEPLARFTFVLLDECLHHFDHLSLLFSGQLGDFVEGAVNFPDGAFALGDVLGAGRYDQLIDAHSEGFGHFRKQV